MDLGGRWLNPLLDQLVGQICSCCVQKNQWQCPFVLLIDKASETCASLHFYKTNKIGHIQVELSGNKYISLHRAVLWHSTT